jgi:hypothetical protein
MQSETAAWPFLNPVNGELIKDYYQTIKEPMGEWECCFFSLTINRTETLPIIASKHPEIVQTYKPWSTSSNTTTTMI